LNLFYLLFLFFLCFVSHSAARQSQPEFRRVCYFTNWSCDLLEPEAHFCIRHIDPTLCTHVVYAFAQIDPVALTLIPTRRDDEDNDGGRYSRFNELVKTESASTKTLLSIGGLNQTEAPFTAVAGTNHSRTLFAHRSSRSLRQWGFDGLDVDWEYPQSEDRQLLTSLLMALRAEFKAEARRSEQGELILSVAAPVSKEMVKAGYDIPGIAKQVDMINLMAYDFHGAWSDVTGVNSPLFPRRSDPRFSPEHSVEWSVNYWISNGAAASKINLGIAGYGQSRESPIMSTGVGSAAEGPGRPGRLRHLAGQLSYPEICELIQHGGQEMWDAEQKVPYAISGDQWVGYDNGKSIAEKVKWAVTRGLGGVMFWSLDLDDFTGGYCGAGRFPLLSAINRTVSE
ncbi:hypothetical protein EGW08_004376, partial [Elysia chlorotica]